MTTGWLTTVARRLEWDPDTATVRVDGEDLHEPTLRDLRQVLSGHLYTSWHIRRPQDEQESRFYRDAEFEGRLAQATPVRRTLRVGVVVSSESSTQVVELDGVRVEIPRDQIVQRDGDVVQVSVPAARPSLSPGFWLADGSPGRPAAGQGLLRVYLSIGQQSSAPAVWSATLEALEREGVRYRAKVGSSARLYPRTDACVVYLGEDALDQWRDARSGPVQTVADAASGTGGLADATSVLTDTVAPGVAIAQEPLDPRPGMRGMSFGEHRCYAVATGVLRSRNMDELPDQVERALREAGIDPENPALNVPPVQEESGP